MKKLFFKRLSYIVVFVALNLPYYLYASDFYVPDTISPHAQSLLKSFSRSALDANRIIFPSLTDFNGWRKIQEKSDKQNDEQNKQIIEYYQPTLIKTKLGGIPVVDIRPKGWKENNKILVYAHGGGYIVWHADTTYCSSVPMANDTGLRVIAVDYTLAPFAKFDQVTDEVIAVIQALVKNGYHLKDIGMFGDSAGGGLATAVTLKLRNKGIGLPGALVLWSPWADLSGSGDTFITLEDHDPLVLRSFLSAAAEAYADPKQYKNPYVSPIYGDFRKGFPPTLIQVGTKEILLSDSVRLYQAISLAGQIAKLDVYEGMWHVFQGLHYGLKESQIARIKSAAFFRHYLGFTDVVK